MSTDLQVSRPLGAVAEANTQTAIAEVQAAMMVAQSRRRNVIQAEDRVKAMCQRRKLAESAVYSYKRGGSEVSGPTIRLAEAIALAWGGIHSGVRVLESHEEYSVVQVYAWDLESNVKETKTFNVSHYRHTKAGTTLLTDPRDVYEAVANQASRRKRACILAVIPGDIVETALEECNQTLKANVTITPQKIASLVEKFGEYGVTKAMIEKRIQCRVEAMNAPNILSLGKIYNSMKDGASTAESWFDMAPESPADELNAPKPLPAAEPKKLEAAPPAEKKAVSPDLFNNAPDETHQGQADNGEISVARDLELQIGECIGVDELENAKKAVNAALKKGQIMATDHKKLHDKIKSHPANN